VRLGSDGERTTPEPQGEVPRATCAALERRHRQGTHPHRESVEVLHRTSPPEARHEWPRLGAPPLRTIPRRSWRVNFSLVSQIDGLLYHLRGLRLERDVMATSREDSYCPFFGRHHFESSSSFIGLYMSDFHLLPAAIEEAARHHAFGVFVVPVWKGRYPMLGPAGKQLPWYEFLLSKSQVIFDLPASAFSCDGKRVEVDYAIQAVVASFDYVGKFKAKRRRERRIGLELIPELDEPPFKIGVTPVLMTRVSPLADKRAPTPAMDTARAATGQVVMCPPALLPARQTSWDVPMMEAWARDYPHPGVVALALQAVGAGCDPFVGDVTKPVQARQSTRTPQELDKCRARLAEEVSAGRAAGPFPSIPLAGARPCPYFSIPKMKHDPTCADIRIVMNFSKGGSESVNGLCWSPHFLAFHCGAKDIRDRIAACGRGAVGALGDVPSCFRHLRLNPRLWPLFVYQCVTSEFGEEFFVDQSLPFGWTPSEWGWQAVLAVIEWQLRRLGLEATLAYVDNFFLIQPATDPRLQQRVDAFYAMFEAAGIPLHEVSVGQRFKGLGWLWDTASMQMSCPEDKHVVLCQYLATWVANLRRPAPAMSLADLETCVGIMQWLSAGFPIGRASLTHLIHLKTEAKALQRRKRLSASTAVVKVTKQGRFALEFWHEAFAAWDRHCPIRMGFSPAASWEVLGRVDASTDWGCGGIYYDGTNLWYFMHKWTDGERSDAFVEKRASTGVMEMMGAHHWLRVFGGFCTGRRLQLELDNSASVLTLEASYTKTEAMLDVLKPVLRMCVEQHIILRARHIMGVVFNQVADLLSHNQLAQAVCRARAEFGASLVCPPSQPTL
jgi:hypothetical protein